MKKTLTWTFQHLPLPMLALAASYGVYIFNLLFVPMWVALVSAAAFELVYIAISLTPSNRRQALWVAGSAVAVSIIYNSLAGLFHLRPELLIDKPLWADVVLAMLHGLPLATIAFFFAVLVLHVPTTEFVPQEPAQRATADADIVPLRPEQGELQLKIRTLAAEGLSDQEIAESLGATVQRVRYWRTVRLNGHHAG